MQKKATGPIRVAVIGGGCAALTTAFELTRPEHAGRYAVTVYQSGWRLGGKGASGRGADGRIEEHGLHLWMGFYENAFRLMRECYAELGRSPGRCPIASWEEAFEPAPLVGVVDRLANGGLSPWVVHFPASPGMPGEPGARSYTVVEYLRQTAALVETLVRSALGQEATRDPASAARGPEAILETAERLLRLGQLATAAALHEAVDLLSSAIRILAPAALRDGLVLRLVDAISFEARRQLENVVRGDPELRRIWLVVDLVLAVLRGSVRFGLALDPRGFDAINDYDWREWLRLNGASQEAVDSAFLRGIYSLVFAFDDGDARRPSLAAGVALRGAMRMFFTYRGSLFWRMTAGMGDVMFAPLYEVLSRRGVRFEFFHRLRNVALGPAGAGPRHVSALELDVQAKVKGGQPYRPLVEVEGLPCWPSSPDFDQLASGKRMAAEGWSFEAPWETRRAAAKTLRVGEDFDLVVLGVGVAALPHAAGELLAAEPRWRTMVESTKTVATQAFQVWMSEEMPKLGWKHPLATVSGIPASFDTWADMSHLTVRERVAGARSIAYFCSALPDPEQDGGLTAEECAAALSRVRASADRFLDDDAVALWPGAADGTGRFRRALLAGQHASANVSPTDRYTLSVPGSLRHRISPLELTFSNLTVAGDWTQSGLDSGCVESAVMSGMLAAHALSLEPPLSRIVGYDHP